MALKKFSANEILHASELNTMVDAIDANTSHVGTMANLKTENKQNLVAAINEVQSNGVLSLNASGQICVTFNE